jgi:hypothetical protein
METILENIILLKDYLLGRHCGRVVKAIDLKSIGFSRAGSNPANVVFIN